MRSTPKLWLVLLFSGACAAPSAKPGATEIPPSGVAEEPASPAAPGTAEPGRDGGSAEIEPRPDASLPEVSVESVGMHVGGGANDPASKEPFQRVLAQRFADLRACYRLVEEPKSGTFGVDLHIPRGGGRPRVEQARTALRGEAFRACVIRVFESTEFEKTKVPTVVSYSVRFSVGY